MATHSSILAWRISQTEEHGGLQSMGSQSQTQLSGLSMLSISKVAMLLSSSMGLFLVFHFFEIYLFTF